MALQSSTLPGNAPEERAIHQRSSLLPRTGRTGRKAVKMRVRFERKLSDLWIGAYWRPWERVAIFDPADDPFLGDGTLYDIKEIWICLVPCFPLHITLQKRIENQML